MCLRFSGGQAVYFDSQKRCWKLTSIAQTVQNQRRSKEASPDCRKFFAECDRLSISTEMAHFILQRCAADAPSYESLLEWRRGTPPPPLTSFDDWLVLIRLAAGEHPEL